VTIVLTLCYVADLGRIMLAVVLLVDRRPIEERASIVTIVAIEDV
jgi:hypothetical protein